MEWGKLLHREVFGVFFGIADERQFTLAESISSGDREHSGCCGRAGSLFKRTQGVSLLGLHLPELQEDVALKIFCGGRPML